MNEEKITRHPLAWPIGWKRTQSHARKPGRFSRGERHYFDGGGGGSTVRARDLTVTDGVARVLRELQRLGIGEDDVIISTNVALRLDGLPRSGQPMPSDPGVAVYWQRRGAPMRCMAIDRYTTVADNLAAVAATLEYMRGIERHGGAEILDRTFTGFTALAGPGTKKPWREILGVGARADVDLDNVRARYRSLAAIHHPDKPGGNTSMMTELNLAMQEAERELG